MFKTPTVAETEVAKIGKENDRARLNWYNDYSLPTDVYESTESPKEAK